MLKKKQQQSKHHVNYSLQDLADQSMVSADPILGLVHPFPIPSMLASKYTPFNNFDMPVRKIVNWIHCAINIEDLVVPCYNCGEWFHLQFLAGHLYV